ncbi:MAG: HAD family hydrolase [Pseudomonadota bacterium]
MSTGISVVGLDADDTLWENETFFRLTQDRFAELLKDHVDGDHLMDRLLEAETRNIGHYGFGIKGFVLSMIETALDVTGDRVPASVIRELVNAGQEMLQHPVRLLPHAAEVVDELSAHHELVLITKGDLLHQEQKIARSGLGDQFDRVEIVSTKTVSTYQRIFGSQTEAAMMVGDSMASDVRPALSAGAWGVFVPTGRAWALEAADPPEDPSRYFEICDLGELPGVIRQI